MGARFGADHLLLFLSLTLSVTANRTPLGAMQKLFDIVCLTLVVSDAHLTYMDVQANYTEAVRLCLNAAPRGTRAGSTKLVVAVQD
jgi:hypothetical protein